MLPIRTHDSRFGLDSLDGVSVIVLSPYCWLVVELCSLPAHIESGSSFASKFLAECFGVPFKRYIVLVSPLLDDPMKLLAVLMI